MVANREIMRERMNKGRAIYGRLESTSHPHGMNNKQLKVNNMCPMSASGNRSQRSI